MNLNNNPTDKLNTTRSHTSRKDIPTFSTNIEKLLLKATTDRNFKEILIKDRNSVFENPELSLTPQDKIILNSIPSNILEDMIDKFSRQRTSRRNFLKGAAVTVSFLAGFLFISPSLKAQFSMGIRPTKKFPVGIGTEEKTINYLGYLQLIIPEKSVNEPITIIIELVENYTIEQNNEKRFIKIFNFSPEDTEFLKEVTIKYRITPDIKEVSVVYYDLPLEKTELPVEITDNWAIFKTKKLGTYIINNPGAEPAF